MTDTDVVIIGGGQSGLAGAFAARDAGLRPVLLEAGERAVGSWPQYYDSLALFSPARYSGFPGAPFPGNPDRYPTRDEVVAYLERLSLGLDAELHTNTRATAVERDGAGYLVHTDTGDEFHTPAVICSSGSFTNPHIPTIPGSFTGHLLHVADYRGPKPYAGQRVVVVGAGNSAVQIAYELAEVATVTMAVRRPVQFVPQLRGGRDMHYWLHTLRIDLLPPSVLSRLIHGTPVFDTGLYAEALKDGRLDQRPVFTRFDGDRLTWADGTQEQVDTVVFATGYRPNLPYLQGLGALDSTGMPLHNRGISTTHPGLAYLGVEFQRSFSSNTLRGVSRDARYVVHALTSGRSARR
ncbi:flavin-containing monooxygenase [Kribbella shirazensis]|uniref:Putative flavoprotein involved in K+ transport n=1 Tax=Kribbella shirazensis TaxID=1105143 RepID=A0A7X5VEU5_9ACTN|nr:NAD(P)/FAD-dependent oxidoreductase [Kribbella shirazensis]NIK59862.1 putative flavoprotein involved in K+ transport [Kribbella shirazensis]